MIGGIAWVFAFEATFTVLNTKNTSTFRNTDMEWNNFIALNN